MKCEFCKKTCIKKGKTKGIQRYYCKECKKYHQETYIKPRISKETQNWIVRYNNEGLGISSIGRLLHIAKSSVQRLIAYIASKLKMPIFSETAQCYEIDELHTFCKNKKNECWVIYAINRKTKQVIDYCVGRRTKENIAKVVKSVLLLNPKYIYTDGLNIYQSLLPKTKHKIYERCTNYIERMNLSLRTHLKRLCRKTICFTKSEKILECCTKIYFLG